MPRLSAAKQRLIKDALDADIDVPEIASLAECHIATVYRMRSSLDLFGSPYPPSCGIIGRPRTFTDEEEGVK